MNELEVLINKYQNLFGLHNWKIVINIDEAVKPYIRTYADPKYNLATISVTTQFLNNKPIWNELVIHELIHIVMALYDFFTDNLGIEGSEKLFDVARENATSQLTSIMLRLMKEQL